VYVNRRIGVSSAGARCLFLDPCELRALLRLPTLQYASALSVWLVHSEPEHDLRDHGITLVVAAVRKMPRLQWLTIGADRTSTRSAIDAGLRAIGRARSGGALRTLELLQPPTPETARMLAAACNGALETYRCAYAPRSGRGCLVTPYYLESRPTATRWSIWTCHAAARLSRPRASPPSSAPAR